MSYVGVPHRLGRVEREKLRRPMGVMVVAIFQVFKAGVLLLTGILLKVNPQAVIGSQSTLYPLLYVAMRGNATILKAATEGNDVLPTFIIAWGFYIATLGAGLWLLQGWARRSIVFTSGLTLVLYAKAIIYPSATVSAASGAPDLQNLHVLVFFDSVMFFYLMMGHTTEYFETKK